MDRGEVTWRAIRADVAARLAAAGLDTAEHDARWIVCEASGLTPGELAAGDGGPATDLGVANVERMVARRRTGEPIQYVLGGWSFRTLDLFVDRRVLIPRPETEEVVGHALVELDRRHAELRAGGDERLLRAVDLGTGSGAIGLSVAAERERVAVWLADRSTDALDVARANLAGIGAPATRATVVEGSWFEALPADLRGALDVVVSNPPYVSGAEAEALDASVRDWEPVEALVPGPTGLEAIEHLVAEAIGWLVPGGSLVLEIGAAQGDDARDLAARAGYVDVVVHQDLAGRDRALVARRPD